LKKNAEIELEIMLNGDLSRIDPDMPMEYKTEFLPYDRKMGISKEKTKTWFVPIQFLITRKIVITNSN
jgi:hypothetical protein